MIPVNENTYESHCRSCPNDVNCCIFENNRGFTFAGIKDAEKIKKHTGLKYSDFLDFSPLKKQVVKSLKDDDPCLEGALRYSQLDEKKSILRLKTKHGGRCVFLEDSGKCGIYDIRPNICRIYPFWAIRLISNKLKIIEHDVGSGCGIISSLNKDICKNLPGKEQIKIKKIFREIEKEDIVYKKGIKKFITQNNIKAAPRTRA